MLAGRWLDVVIVVVTAATLAELLADGRPGPALVSAVSGLVLLARHRAPAIAIVVSIAGQLALAALLSWHEPAGAFGLFLLTFVVAGGLRPEWAAWLGWACGVAQAATVEAQSAGNGVQRYLAHLRILQRALRHVAAGQPPDTRPSRAGGTVT